MSTAAEAGVRASRAAEAAGVTVREVRSTADARAVADLFMDIWGRPGSPLVTPELLVAFAKTENYVWGAYAGDTLVGGCVGFHAGAPRPTLYSHIAGVAPGMAGRHVGWALKLHQRAWALSRGIELIEWTFDPLVARNAHVNVVKLAAHPVDYLTNFYGSIGDAINGADETDRLLVRWVLDEPVVVAACAGTPLPPAAADTPGVVRVAVPDDIEGLRTSDPASAGEWRRRVRAELAPLLAGGATIIGFERSGGYVVRTEGAS